MNYKFIDLPDINKVAEEVLQHMDTLYKTTTRFVSHPVDYFDDFTTLFNSLSVIKSKADITNIAIVSVAPYTTMAIHVDDLSDGHMSAINIPISGCEQSYTCFYKLKNNAAKPMIMYNTSNDVYYQYATDDVEEIDRFYLHKAAVFNTQVLHNVVNNTAIPRIILSIRFNTPIDIYNII